MKNLITLLLIIVSFVANGQTFRGTLKNNILTIKDTAIYTSTMGASEVKWRFIVYGNAYNYQTPKIQPGTTFQQHVDSIFNQGFAIQKVVCYRFGNKWHENYYQGYSIGLVLDSINIQPSTPDTVYTQSNTPDTVYIESNIVDTVYLQPANIVFPTELYGPDWYTTLNSGYSFVLVKNADCPYDADVEDNYFVSYNGYLYFDTNNLPPGIYYHYVLIKWRGMFFLDINTIVVT